MLIVDKMQKKNSTAQIPRFMLSKGFNSLTDLSIMAAAAKWGNENSMIHKAYFLYY